VTTTSVTAPTRRNVLDEHEDPSQLLERWRKDGDLQARERAIIRLRFIEELSQAEIGRRVGISQMQVSRLLRRSLQQLRVLTDAQVEEP